MAWIPNEKVKEEYIKLMAHHFRKTITEEELRKQIEGDPTVLEDFVDWLQDGGEVMVI